MALIGKIRDKSWLVLLVIGGALAAFILSDWQSLFTGDGFEHGYGTMNGERIDMQAFDAEVNEQQRMADIQAQAQENQTAAQQNRQAQVKNGEPVNRDQIWTGFVEDLLLKKEYESIGISVSEEEFESYLFAADGFEPLADFANSFKDSSGTFNAQLLQTRIDEMENSDDVSQQEIWKNYRESLKERRKQEKYKDILGHTMYVSDLQAKDEYFAQQEVKGISFVLHRYSSIDDSEVDDSDEKLKAYFEAHKTEKIYEITESVRELKYIDFALDPSGEDSTKFDNDMASLKAGLAATQDDSMFVVKNSDNRFFMSRAVYRPTGDAKAQPPMTYPPYMDTLFKKALIGDVIGPYNDQGVTKIAKLIGTTDKSLSVRHILIGAQRGNTDAVAVAQKTTDSIMNIINKDNFEELVKEHSTDQGSVQNGGKYESFLAEDMVPEFGDFSLNEPIGKIGYVQTDYGFHIIEVLGRKDTTSFPKLAVIEKKLVASGTAISSKQDEVHDFLYNLDEQMSKTEDLYKKVEIFDTLAFKKGHSPRVMRIVDNKPVVNGLASQTAENKMLELAFSPTAATGDIVGSPIRDKNRLMIAVVSSIKEEGPGKFEDLKEKVRAEYMKDEKAKILIAKMGKAKTLSALEDQEKGIIVHKSDVTFGAPQIQNAGSDPYVVGAIFGGLKDGEQTNPIKGNLGVYVIKLETTTKAAAAVNYDQEKDQLTLALQNSIKARAMQGLTKLADVVDNRKLFNAGIRR